MLKSGEKLNNRVRLNVESHSPQTYHNSSHRLTWDERHILAELFGLYREETFRFCCLKTKDKSIQIAGLLPRSLHETAQEDPELESKGFRDDVTSPPDVRVRVFVPPL